MTCMLGGREGFTDVGDRECNSSGLMLLFWLTVLVLFPVLFRFFPFCLPDWLCCGTAVANPISASI